MNYCSNCAHPLIHEIPAGDHLPRYQCKNCNTIHYINPNMVVGCIPVYKGEIMLAKRGIAPRKGLWNLPCGFLEMGETAEEGAQREVLEETGIEVVLDKLHTVYSVVHSGQVFLIYLAEMQHTRFQLNEESSEIKLFAPQDIPWENIAFSANTFALKNYLNDLENGFTKVHLGSRNLNHE